MLTKSEVQEKLREDWARRYVDKHVAEGQNRLDCFVDWVIEKQAEQELNAEHLRRDVLAMREREIILCNEITALREREMGRGPTTGSRWAQ